MKLTRRAFGGLLAAIGLGGKAAVSEVLKPEPESTFEDFPLTFPDPSEMDHSLDAMRYGMYGHGTVVRLRNRSGKRMEIGQVVAIDPRYPKDAFALKDPGTRIAGIALKGAYRGRVLDVLIQGGWFA